jgi:hypothetical protein
MKFTTLARQSIRLERRKRSLGLTGDRYVAVNSGTRRSPEKRALLQKLAQLALDKGRMRRFPGKF